MDIGAMIRSRRLTLGITQKDLARAVGVTESAVSLWESGHIDNIRNDKIKKLSEVLCLDPVSFFRPHDYLDPDVQELLDAAAKIPPEKRNLALRMLKTLMED